MEQKQRVVTILPATQKANSQAYIRQLKVAAYCRVSTEEEEQQSSYEAQCGYYTDKIMSNPQWSMVRIFADEGISGTSTKRRKDFNQMIRYCKQGKIDLILTKSISRFARNTLDTINYTRMLKAMGIGIYFEKENINTLEMDSEMLITLLGAFAQAESESISRNVFWGKRQAMREGKVTYHYKSFYGYRKGADGKPEIIPEQAEVYKNICRRFLSGYSLRNIVDELKAENIPYLDGKEWNIVTLRNLLSNEKYCGDALLQKTYVEDCITKKVVKNTGQREQVLVENCHPAIITKDMHKAMDVLESQLEFIGEINDSPEVRAMYGKFIPGTETMDRLAYGTAVKRLLDQAYHMYYGSTGHNKVLLSENYRRDGLFVLDELIK